MGVDGVREKKEEGWYEEEAAFHPGIGKQASPLGEEGLFFRPEGSGEGTTALGSALPFCMADSQEACTHTVVSLRGGICAGMAIAVAAGACGNRVHPDEGPPDRGGPSVTREFEGREAEKAGERSGGGDGVEEDLEIACEILCPD